MERGTLRVGVWCLVWGIRQICSNAEDILDPNDTSTAPTCSTCPRTAGGTEPLQRRTQPTLDQPITHAADRDEEPQCTPPGSPPGRNSTGRPWVRIQSQVPALQSHSPREWAGEGGNAAARVRPQQTDTPVGRGHKETRLERDITDRPRRGGCSRDSLVAHRPWCRPRFMRISPPDTSPHLSAKRPLVDSPARRAGMSAQCQHSTASVHPQPLRSRESRFLVSRCPPRRLMAASRPARLPGSATALPPPSAPVSMTTCALIQVSYVTPHHDRFERSLALRQEHLPWGTGRATRVRRCDATTQRSSTP